MVMDQQELSMTVASLLVENGHKPARTSTVGRFTTELPGWKVSDDPEGGVRVTYVSRGASRVNIGDILGKYRSALTTEDVIARRPRRDGDELEYLRVVLANAPEKVL